MARTQLRAGFMCCKEAHLMLFDQITASDSGLRDPASTFRLIHAADPIPHNNSHYCPASPFSCLHMRRKYSVQSIMPNTVAVGAASPMPVNDASG